MADTGEFDVEGARKAGYTDDEILKHLGDTHKFDTQGALDSGYSKDELITHLSPRPLRDTGVKSFPGETTGSIPTDFLMGGVSSLAQIPVGGYNLVRKALPFLPAPPDYLQNWTAPPDTAAGHLGEFAGDVGTFALPGGVEEKLVTKIGASGKLARAAVRGGVSAASTGAIEAVKSGGDLDKTAAAAASAGLISGGTEAAAKPVINAITDLWGKATGAGGEAIRTAATQSSQLFKDAMRYHRSESQIVDDLNDAVHTVMTQRGVDYRAAMSQIDQTIQLNISPVRRELADQLAAFKVNVMSPQKSGRFMGSPIINETDRDAMMRAAADVSRWKDFSPSGLDTLKQRLTGYADGASPRAQPFFYRIADAAKRELNDHVPGYEKLTADYSTASDLLKTVQKELSANAANPGTTMRKLTYIFNQNNEFRKVLLESLDQAAGSDLKNTLAGYALRTPMPRGLAGVGAGMLSAWQHDPRVLGTLAFGSPRVAGEAMALLSILRRSRMPGIPGSAVAPAISNQVLPTELTPPPARLPSPPAP